MATIAPSRATTSPEDRFFIISALAMAALIFTAFSFQLAMGRSSFASPPIVHLHAVTFMGWVVIYVLQATFGATGRRDLHRTLGWIATGWVAAMVALGTTVTVLMARAGHVPFFFQPVQFLIFDPMTVITFAGLNWTAVAMRRRTDWHRRLHFCAMANLLSPAFGRLLPLPLVVPLAYELTAGAALIVPVVAIMRERRRTGSVHPAWWVGTGAMVASVLLIELLTYSPAGPSIYAAATAGSRGAALDPYAFSPPPGSPLITGR